MFNKSSEIQRSETDLSYEIAYGEFVQGDLINLESWLGRLRNWLVITLLLFLLIVEHQNPVGPPLIFFIFMIGLIALQFYLYSQRHHDRNRLYKDRWWRLQYYLLLCSILLFYGRGSDIFLLLFISFVISSSIYTGTLWGVISSLQGTLYVFAILSLLNVIGVDKLTLEYILPRVIAILIMGLTSTYLWFRYVRYRKSVAEYEEKVLNAAVELTATLDFDKALQQTFKLLSDLIKFDGSLILADTNQDGTYRVLANWNNATYPALPDFSFRISEIEQDEGLIETLIKTRKSLLVTATDQNRTKYREFTENKFIRSFLGSPLIYGEELIGAIVVTSDKLQCFGQNDLATLEGFSKWLVITIKNALAHKQIKEWNRYLQEIIDLSRDSVLVADANGRIVLHNAAARILLGYQEQELSQRTAGSLYVKGDEEARRIQKEIYSSGMAATNLKSEVLTSSNEKVNILLSASALLGPNRQELTVGFFRDIENIPLPEKRVRALLDVSVQGMRFPVTKSHDLAQHVIDVFDSYFEGKLIVVIRLIRNGKLEVVATSQSANVLELQGLTLERGEGIAGRVWEKGEPEIVYDLQNNQYHAYPHFLISHNLSKGIFLPLSYRSQDLGIMIVYGQDEKPFSATETEFLVKFSEQTSLLLATAELTNRYLEQQAVAVVGEVAINSAYRMRTPLTTIRGWVQILQKNNPEGFLIDIDKNIDALQCIERATLDLEDIMGKMLQATKTIEVSLAPVDLYALVQATLSSPSIQKLTTNENINVKLIGIENPVLVNADSILLTQALREIVNNAIEEHSSRVDIIIEPAEKGRKVALIIRDNGPGISLKDFDHIDDIFLPFASTKKVARRKGHGIGLALTRRIIQAHQGSLLVRNLPGAGAEFNIELQQATFDKVR